MAIVTRQKTADVTVPLSVQIEQVTLAAGAAGTTGSLTLQLIPVYNQSGDGLSTYQDTSFGVLSGDALTNHVATALLVVANGDYHVDALTGVLTYQKATASTAHVFGYASPAGTASSSSGAVLGFGYKQIVDEAAAPAITYIGYASPGTATSAAAWQIKRVSVSGTTTTIEFAGGSAGFTSVWDNRAILAYS